MFVQWPRQISNWLRAALVSGVSTLTSHLYECIDHWVFSTSAPFELVSINSFELIWSMQRARLRCAPHYTAVLVDGSWLAVVRYVPDLRRWTWVHASGSGPGVVRCAAQDGYYTASQAQSAALTHLEHMHRGLLLDSAVCEVIDESRSS